MQQPVTIGNIDPEHPYFHKMLDFCEALMNEMPFHNTLSATIQALLAQEILTDAEYVLIFPKAEKEIAGSVVDYLNHRTYQQVISDDFTAKGVKAILKSLIMYQINLHPNMGGNFKKLFGNALLSQSLTEHPKRLHSLINFLWCCAGDQATDYNYYSKRFLLSNIYIKTIFYACSDTSEHYQDTEQYLVKSFDNIGKIEKFKSKLPDISKIEENIISFLGSVRHR